MSIAIEVDSLSKKYRLGEYQAAYGTLRETLVHAGRRIMRKDTIALHPRSGRFATCRSRCRKARFWG